MIIYREITKPRDLRLKLYDGYQIFETGVFAPVVLMTTGHKNFIDAIADGQQLIAREHKSSNYLENASCKTVVILP